MNRLRQHGSRSILEVGCGSGFLAEMLMQGSTAAYRGFDFSEVAIRNAGSRTGRPEVFFLGDARDAQSYAFEDDSIVCTEVLEHIDADLEVVQNWKAGSWCVCSVPNFDWESHVRFFRSIKEIRERYGDLIAIETVIRVPCLVIPGGNLRRYLRELRWSRNNPSELLGVFGIQRFERLGGWFLFCETKKNATREPRRFDRDCRQTDASPAAFGQQKRWARGQSSPCASAHAIRSKYSLHPQRDSSCRPRTL
jgi:SAM-dependent methyltransferase